VRRGIAGNGENFQGRPSVNQPIQAPGRKQTPKVRRIKIKFIIIIIIVSFLTIR
jgi:hypothetical protein